jgi:hypothetical protein
MLRQVSPERARKRTAHKRLAYRGKDRAELIARLTAEQGGVCACCDSRGTMRGDGSFGLVLDHDHKTGAPRAMLCCRCNAALGLARENPETLRTLAEYAEMFAVKREGDTP